MIGPFDYNYKKPTQELEIFEHESSEKILTVQGKVARRIGILLENHQDYPAGQKLANSNCHLTANHLAWGNRSFGEYYTLGDLGGVYRGKQHLHSGNEEEVQALQGKGIEAISSECETDIEIAIEKWGFPLICRLCDIYRKERKEKTVIHHSVIILGKHGNDYICFDQVNIGEPFSCRKLQDIELDHYVNTRIFEKVNN